MYGDEQPDQCLECNNDLDYNANEYSCEECGKRYSKEEYDSLVEKEQEAYVDYMKKMSPSLFK